MDIVNYLILGLVEGLTEFLPVSSTGHMILTAWLLQMQNTEFLKSFEIAIQMGAILSVVILYFRRLIQGPAIYMRLLVAFLPTATIGFVMYKLIKDLFHPAIVAINLILGGLILLLLHRDIEAKQPDYAELEVMPLKNAFMIGLIQCLAMIPGVSRAGATIIGAVYNGCDKKMATEFSFLLAIPTMLAATAYDMLKNAHAFTSQEYGYLAIGFVAAFVSAWLAVKVFIELVVRYGFAGFGWYRIVVGTLVLLAIGLGAPLTH
ncbi:MAG: UDP-diphosphatase [Candidatus Melainabacteria bacterium HGW-Melainabacteria-1]|nr:MAG: UDP-diphosphatase [Candidatus Melainabacteria bacterium HGW-Melainabacteria-1]